VAVTPRVDLPTFSENDDRMNIRRVTYFRLLNGDRLCAFGLDRDAVWASRGHVHVPGDAGDWSMEEDECDAKTATAAVHSWGTDTEPLWHVHWRCPVCRDEHHTDVGTGMSGTELWACETSERFQPVIVTWPGLSEGSSEA